MDEFKNFLEAIDNLAKVINEVTEEQIKVLKIMENFKKSLEGIENKVEIK